jgi:hypothetical protein
MAKPLPQNDKISADTALQPGDPWTFIRDQPLRNAETGEPLKPGDGIVQKAGQGSLPRLFEVRAIHRGCVYETTYRGLKPQSAA